MSDEARASVDEPLWASSDVVAAEATLNPETGVIASTFHVEADTLEAADKTGIRVFNAALDEARLIHDHGWLLIETRGP
jgi:hypothetical protein